jgi:predicted helicase
MSLVAILETSTNWSDIYTHLINQRPDNLSNAGKAFEQLAKLYFQCEPSVRDEYKNVWLFNEVPPHIKKMLDLGHQDYGVDLVLEDHEGCLSVVQSKFKQDQNASLSWSKDKLTNLLADGDKADFIIIFTNASRIDTHTLSKKQNKLRVFTLGDLIHISSETIQAMRQKKVPITQPKKQPKPYQAIAIDKTVEGLTHNDRGQLILPCGTGKTLISLWIHERLNPDYTLVLFPSLALLRQTKNEWAANRQQYVPYICVCSEKDIDKGDSTQVRLYELSGNVSTDPMEIRAYLLKHKQIIVFSTYQSLAAVAEAIQDTDIEFDLALCDEAHKTAGSKKGVYGLVHDHSKIQLKKRLYMTATPRILGDNAKKYLNDEEVAYVADMNDLTTFGSELYHMTFKEAIDQGILVDYKIIAMGFSDTEIATLIKERQYIKDDVTADELANNYALEKFMAKYNSGHAITFHSSVNKARKFQERHQDLFTDIEAFHVSGKQTTNERSITLNAFANSHKSVVTNARCLTEGVDVPAIDAVYFCDPKNSKIDIVQAAGRALRRADHLRKKLGYIVVPIFHRNKDELEDAIEESVFSNLISVVRALSSHDERLVDEIRKIKLGRGQSHSQSNHLVIDGMLNLITIEDMGDLSEQLFDQVVSKIRVPCRSFKEARAVVRSLNLKSVSEWKEYCKCGKKPEDIPTNPNRTYRGGNWKSWWDWLGTGNRRGEWMPFNEARTFVHTLNLKGESEWREYYRSGTKPDDIPSAPDQLYKNKGWKSWSDWLNTENISGKLREYWSFENARAYARSLKFENQKQWFEFCKTKNRPKDIPTAPNQVYIEWKGWGDWLDTGYIASRLRKYQQFEDARAFAHSLNLSNQQQWFEYSKNGDKPEDIPAKPNRTYVGKGWSGWGDWLGKL